MRAAQLQHPGAPIRLVEVPRPTPGPGQAVVKVAAAGVCHSDLTIQAQRPGMSKPLHLPMTLGHEISGHVEELGEGTTGLRIGEAVGVWPGWGDRTCAICRSGYEHLCHKARFPGVIIDGGWADYLLVPHSDYLVPLGDLDPAAAAPLTDAGLTSYGAVKKTLPHLQGSSRTVAVIGAGGLGQFAIKYLSALTQASIITIDTDSSKRNQSMTIGSSHAVDPTEADVEAGIRALSDDGQGVNAVIDFVGSDRTLQLAGTITAPRGRLVLVGINGGSLPFGYGVTAQEVELSTSTLGSREDLREVIELARSRGINTETSKYAFEDVNQALADLESNKILSRAALMF